ncbi:hypothetical protein P3T73_03585 [Kiritimatiellota bacterium B12222]|nr:hypothetical protein P3T73_03585 [Kiritimatiellota bacterium B12222]
MTISVPSSSLSKHRFASRSGSVLLLTLLIVSLLLVIVMTFTVYVRMGLREISDRQESYLAQSNARLAMHLAIGSLQQYAGKDQRITATAQLAGSSQQPYWTGVWASDESATPWPGVVAGDPIWLVSGSASPSPDMPIPSGQKVRMYPDDDALSDAEEVIVPVEEFTHENQTHRFAWWVGDEGVKARVDLVSPNLTVSDKERTNRSQSPQGPGISTIKEGWSDDPLWTTDTSIQKLSSRQTIALQDPDFPLSVLRHDLTPYSLGLPVNVKDGGLKADWSTVLDRSFEGSTLVEYNLGARPSASVLMNGVNVYTYPRSRVTNPDRFYLSTIGSSVAERPGPNLSILWQYGRLWQMLSANRSLTNVTAQPTASIPIRTTDWLPYQGVSDIQHSNAPVAPVLSNLRFGMRLTASPKGGNTYAIGIEYKPLIGLWNPYNIGLDANNYSMDWYISPYVKIRITNSITNEVTEHIAWGKRQWPGKWSPSQPGGQYLRLRINDADFEPGEVRFFSLSQRTTDNQVHQIARKFIFLESAWSEEGVIPASFDQSLSGNRVALEGVPQGSIIEVLEVGLHDSYLDETHTHWSYSEPGSATWITLKTNDSDDGTNHLDANDGVPIAGFSGLWNSGPVDEKPSSKDNLIPELIHKTADLPPNTTPEAIVDSPAHLATWSFHLRTTSDITDATQRMRNLVDSNPRAMGMNSTWEGDGEFAHTEGWDYLPGWTGEGSGNRGFADEESPQAAPTRYRGFLGHSFDSSTGSTHVPILDVPSSPLISVGQFQHAPLARYDFEPTYVAGNSYASLRIPLDETVAQNYHGLTGFDLHDISYEVNERIWDEIFFSTLAPDYVLPRGAPAAGNNWDSVLADHLDNLPNPRMQYIPGETNTLSDLFSSTGERGAEALAAHIRVLGAFNINSTSKTAWKAVLSSMTDAELPVIDPATGALSWEQPDAIHFNKFGHSLQTDPYETGESNSTGAYWKGWRKLSATELDALATAIVEEVKARGPFRSLADFVNRDPDAATPAHQRKGPLQASLDRSVNRPGSDLNNNLGDLAAKPTGSHFSNAISGEPTATAYAGYLMQGDLLQSLAPILQARSDTFIVRSYGETSSGATAWCEAVLQRSPDYIDPANENWENQQVDGLSLINQTFGRRFEIVSFRWLSVEESGNTL